jgi:choline dehydrogenase-like flavoprotein
MGRPAPFSGDLYDVVIIGSGLGGSTLACRLGGRGLRVLVVEHGDFPRDAIRDSDTPVGPYKNLVPKPALVGGLTKFYGAAMYRLRENDFQTVRHEAGETPGWPIAYADLEAYYTDAERMYRVHGDADEDPTEPPRSANLPFPPLPHAPLVSTMIDRLCRSGACVSSMPRALDYGTGRPCVLCPSCDAYYCRADAKMDAEVAALRPALATGRVTLLTRANCVRIETDPQGARVTGVLVRRDGECLTIPARVVAACAGIEQSPRLLLQSHSARHPRGLGNNSGCVGRYMAGHTAGMLFVLQGARRVPPMHTKTFAINTYYDRSPGWPFPTGTIQAAGQMPFWDGDAVPGWKKPLARLVAERSLYCFFMTEALPTPESGFEFVDGRVARTVPPKENTETFERLRRLAIDTFRCAGYRVIAPGYRSIWHQVGTVRFGSNPATSVLDSTCRVHDIENLYVVDASVLPSAGALNTGLTIAALALRAGDTIAAQMARPIGLERELTVS